MRAKKPTIVYRFLQPTDKENEYKSVSSVYQLIYRPGEWTETIPVLDKQGYWPTCFHNTIYALAMAWQMVAIGRPIELWECEAEQVKRRLPRRACGFSRPDFVPLIARRLGWPDFTIMARRIRPVRRLGVVTITQKEGRGLPVEALVWYQEEGQEPKQIDECHFVA